MSESGNNPAVDPRFLDRAVEGCAASHQALLADVDRALADGALEAPSRLPGWSRGHVLTHLARNADSFIRAIDAASRGEVCDRYPGGGEQRNRDIDDGADRDAEAIVADLRSAVYRLEGAWAGADKVAWSGSTRSISGALERISDTVFLRWREVVVHHADLGLDYSFDDWPRLWVRLELDRQMMQWRATRPMGMGSLPPAVLGLADPQKVAWFLGRLDVPGTPAGSGG